MIYSEVVEPRESGNPWSGIVVTALITPEVQGERPIVWRGCAVFSTSAEVRGFLPRCVGGLWGRISEAAATALDAEYENLKDELGTFDRRTEQQIASLSIRAQREARGFITRALSQGVNVKIISGTRTYEEQNQLFRQGRYGNPGPVITKARGGHSNHNFGIAWVRNRFEQGQAYVA